MTNTTLQNGESVDTENAAGIVAQVHLDYFYKPGQKKEGERTEKVKMLSIGKGKPSMGKTR